MAVKMRLTRLGDKKTPFYRIVISDSKTSRDGEYIDQVGTFNPLVNDGEVKLDNQKGKVIEINPLLEQVRIEFNYKTIKTCLKEEVKVLHVPKKCENGCCNGKCKNDDIDSETMKELKKLED